MNHAGYSIFRFFYSYKRIEKHILYLILAGFFLQMINSVFYLILNLYMSKLGYADFTIANFISYRFLAVMLFAFPLGFLIKGRNLKPFFYTGAVLVPLASFVIIYALAGQMLNLIYVSLIVWGLAFTCIQITVLPFIIRNARPSTHTEAIALNYATWSFSMIISGFAVALLNNIDPVLFNEKILLEAFAILGLISVIFIYKINIKENIPESEYKRFDMKGYDWGLITKALIPTAIISVGAGLTIPFINLFFFHVYGLDSNVFAIMGTGTAILVAFAAVIVPEIKRRFGYTWSITLSQSLSVIALVILASTELYSHLSIAVILAIVCYVIRQPLMNMAAPMTSELTMYYVGKRNQEIISALTSSIWSGSWFISSQIFRILRSADLSYSTVFFITAFLYAIGVVWYYILIVDFKKRKKLGLIL